MNYIFSIIIGYILGSIPFGLVIGFLFYKRDIRTLGSKNIGTTNVLRTCGKVGALFTLILDNFKAVFAYFIVFFIIKYISPNIEYSTLRYISALSSFFAVIGHINSIFLKFKGGKGVATSLGALFIFNPFCAFLTCLVWFFTAIIYRISSLSALVAFTFVNFFMLVFSFDWFFSLLAFILSIFIFYRHKQNIINLYYNTESVIGSKQIPKPYKFKKHFGFLFKLFEK